MESNEEQLIDALNKHDTDRALSLIEAGIDVNFVNPNSDWTLMNYAIEHENILVIKNLLDRGYNINLAGKGKYGWPPAHHAVEFAFDSFLQDEDCLEPETEILECLLTYHPDLTMKDASGRTPFDYANHEKLKRLLTVK